MTHFCVTFRQLSLNFGSSISEDVAELQTVEFFIWLKLKNLNFLNVLGCSVARSGVKRLIKKLPGIRIRHSA